MKRAFSFGIGSLIAGISLYLVSAYVAVSYYDEEPHPTWLVTLSIAAVVLVAVGLLVMANGAIRAYRERS